jgi:hypothetical protein
MSRAIHETTASGDEVTLEANVQVAARGRTVAQVEHNAMQALDLVRATLHVLGEVLVPLDRLALLLAGRSAVTAIAPELQRTIEQLGACIHAAMLREKPLLVGGTVAFVVDDPQDMTSTPLQIELPDLSSAFAELVELDLAVSTHAQLCAKQARLAGLVQRARRQFSDTAQRLSGVLASQRPSSPGPARTADEGFVALIQSVRDRVLHAGNAALRVQGSPSARATWLITALKDAP